MIDQRINESLKQLENSLSELNSAKKQVEDTIKSYDGLKSSTSDYVLVLSSLTSKVKDLIDTIKADYSQKIDILESDRKGIVENANKATQKVSEATETLKKSIKGMEFKLIVSLVLNVFVIVILLFSFLR